MIKLFPLKLIFFFTILLPLLSGCGARQEKAEDHSEAKTPVILTSISEGPIAETIELNAVSGFLKKGIIKSNATGLVERAEINLGDRVEKGQLLFTIKTKEALALEKSNINDSNLRFKGLIKIISSKSGLISAIAHQNGDYVQDGDELAVVSEQSSLVFMLEVPFEIHNDVIRSRSCEIMLPGHRAIPGLISVSLPVMDIQSQTESFIVKPVTDEKLPENLIAKVKIVKNAKGSAVILPKQAVLANETQTEFWVMKLINDSTAIKIPITKGIEDDGKVEILQPFFKSSDRILLEGNYGLPDTALVMVKK
jgi:biotin carboxyl carrier protein